MMPKAKGVVLSNGIVVRKLPTLNMVGGCLLQLTTQ